jgi:rhodanese-related sulfurtransferase
VIWQAAHMRDFRFIAARLPRLSFVLLASCWFVQTILAEPNSNTAKTQQKAAPKAVARRVDVDEFEKLSQNKKNPVLDVRTEKEFAAGHIPGAINLDFNSPQFESKVAALNKERLYLVHCAAGVRSAKACQTMSRLGFTNLVDLAPGFRAWEKAGKPVAK